MPVPGIGITPVSLPQSNRSLFVYKARDHAAFRDYARELMEFTNLSEQHRGGVQLIALNNDATDEEVAHAAFSLRGQTNKLVIIVWRNWNICTLDVPVCPKAQELHEELVHTALNTVTTSTGAVLVLI
ncbi:hypothetical protein [Achromobacter phage Motura]|uniref:Uncharacterized protein n=1 Tax=Achromobacter phage Motura TaxID=2591403 RepID=A0A514CSF2_9CAUD|nr:hypothetical protein H1O15_gp063 [Achromobacter phage Motura]QDH83399.1 hypothetical protein [Achromobacter phage Motura]